MSIQGISGCRDLRSAGRLRDASEMISRHRTVAYEVRGSFWKSANDNPAVKLWASFMLSSMSCNLAEGDLEGMDGILLRRRSHRRFECSAIHNIDVAREKLCNVSFDACILEYAEFGIWIQFDHNIEIAVRPCLSARHRSKQCSMLDAARTEFVAVLHKDGDWRLGYSWQNS